MGSILHVAIRDQFALDHPQEGRRHNRAPVMPSAPFGQLLSQFEHHLQFRIHDGRMGMQRSPVRMRKCVTVTCNQEDKWDDATEK